MLKYFIPVSVHFRSVCIKCSYVASKVFFLPFLIFGQISLCVRACVCAIISGGNDKVCDHRNIVQHVV